MTVATEVFNMTLQTALGNAIYGEVNELRAVNGGLV